jgi:hypothetical protein
MIRIYIYNLLTNFATCALKETLQSDCCDLKEKILIKERDKVDKWRRQWCVESVENDCCDRVIVN